MTIFAWIFLLLFLSTFSVLVIIIRRAMYLDELLENVLEEFKKNFDVLQIVFKNVQHKSKLDIFSDEPVVKDLIDDIKTARNTVFITLSVARDFLLEHDTEIHLNDEEKNQIEK